MVTKSKKKLVSTEQLIKELSDRYEFGFIEFEKNKGMTVECLCAKCIEQIIKGNGQKHVQISMDDEGNGFHTLFYEFSDNEEEIKYNMYHDKVDFNDIVLLG